MLPIHVPSKELWDPKTNEFKIVEECELHLEHSLASISEWESKWKVAFLTSDEKTSEQVYDYIKCMTLDKDVDPLVYSCLTKENVEQIGSYINDSMTATTFRDDNKKPSRKIVTSEVVYAWMVALRIPQEYQYWHFNRLMTLIRVCEIQQQPPKKMGKKATMSRNAALNAARKKRLGTTG